MSKCINIKFKILLVILCLFISVLCFQIDAQEPVSVFFYNPDANVENVAILIRVFNTYFQPGVQGFAIQPFINVETFVNVSLQRRPGFLITPYWNYKLIKKDMSFSSSKMEGILTPITSSQAYYKKIVIVRENSPFSVLSDLHGSIASTSLGLQSLDFLNEFIFKNNVDLTKLEFTWTTKDLDSLLALRFNQVQIAVVNEKTYEDVKASRPAMVQGLKILATSEKVPQALLVKLNNNVDESLASKIKDLFLNMHESAAGREILNLLGYDKWLEYSE